jgi:hypothetical protein
LKANRINERIKRIKYVANIYRLMRIQYNLISFVFYLPNYFCIKLKKTQPQIKCICINFKVNKKGFQLNKKRFTEKMEGERVKKLKKNQFKYLLNVVEQQQNLKLICLKKWSSVSMTNRLKRSHTYKSEKSVKSSFL